jgi:hypothetical protein
MDTEQNGCLAAARDTEGEDAIEVDLRPSVEPAHSAHEVFESLMPDKARREVASTTFQRRYSTGRLVADLRPIADQPSPRTRSSASSILRISSRLKWAIC